MTTTPGPGQLVYYPMQRWTDLGHNLHMGGHLYDPIQQSDSHPRMVIVDREFHLVVSLFVGGSEFGPHPDVRHLVEVIPDGELNPGELAKLRTLAETAVNVANTGRQVLIRCQAGLNRSGLVAGMALMRLGYTADEAVAHIRARRGRWALFNPFFVNYLRAAQR